MSSKSGAEIKTLREYLQKELDAEANNEPFDDDRFRNAFSAIMLVGDEKIYQLKDEVYKFLKVEDEGLRGEAVLTLGYSLNLHLPEFKDEAFKIWETDSSHEVKSNALGVWASYYTDSKDPKVVDYLYKILKNEEYTTDIRYEAIAGIYFVTQEPSSFFDGGDSAKLSSTTSCTTFNSRIDWEEVERIVKKYAPDALK